MATPTRSSLDESKSGTGPRSSTAIWIRAVLDRPLTSYHLVLGSSAILLALGLLMVLSASSVSAYVNHKDSYYYVKRQVIFLTTGVVGAFVIMKLSPSTLRVLSWLASLSHSSC